MGVDRTLDITRKIDPMITKAEVKKVVKRCERRQTIDHVTHSKGIYKNWSRMAMDVTHYRQIPYLSKIDCGPSRFAIWRKLKGETAEEIVNFLN